MLQGAVEGSCAHCGVGGEQEAFSAETSITPGLQT